jgi:hypothetical protein
MLARISSASLVQENGRECSIEPSMKALITTTSSFHRGEGAAPDGMESDDREEAFHEIEPGVTGRSEMQDDPEI